MISPLGITHNIGLGGQLTPIAGCAADMLAGPRIGLDGSLMDHNFIPLGKSVNSLTGEIDSIVPDNNTYRINGGSVETGYGAPTGLELDSSGNLRQSGYGDYGPSIMSANQLADITDPMRSSPGSIALTQSPWSYLEPKVKLPDDWHSQLINTSYKPVLDYNQDLWQQAQKDLGIKDLSIEQINKREDLFDEFEDFIKITSKKKSTNKKLITPLLKAFDDKPTRSSSYKGTAQTKNNSVICLSKVKQRKGAVFNALHGINNNSMLSQYIIP